MNEDATRSAGRSGSNDPADTVRAILEEARRVAGSGPLFAARLEELGVGPETGRYSESAISNWIRGRTMPPADVLLVAASIAGVTLDVRALRTQATEEPGSTTLESVVDGMRAELDDLRSAVIELYGRLGYPMPETDESEEPRRRRLASGSGG